LLFLFCYVERRGRDPVKRRELATAPHALAAEIARLRDELIAERATRDAERERQVAINDGLVARQIEQAEDLRELRCLLRDKGKVAPEGMVALKTAVSLSGANYETSRRWCARGHVHAQLLGGRWFVSLLSLAEELAKRRRTAA